MFFFFYKKLFTIITNVIIVFIIIIIIIMAVRNRNVSSIPSLKLDERAFEVWRLTKKKSLSFWPLTGFATTES